TCSRTSTRRSRSDIGAWLSAPAVIWSAPGTIRRDHHHVFHRHLRLDRSGRAHCDPPRYRCRAWDDAWPHRPQARASMGAGGDGRELGHADLRLRALAAGPDLGLCRRSGKAGGATMIGQPVEITFKTLPGEVYAGSVESVLQAIA